MDSTSVEDFQDYHNHQPVGEVDGGLVSSLHFHGERTHSSTHDIDEDEASLSGSAPRSSSPDEAVFDDPSHCSSPRTSSDSEGDISLLGSHYEPERRKASPFTPLKTRSAFRNPSSVRAMQLETTPPHLASPSSQQRHKLYSPSRQCTPRSTRSHRSALTSPSKHSPTKKMKKEYPLVLLHVTLLPLPIVYSQEVMESVLPPSILENWKILKEKATDTVLERGVLIPHPKEDYDLLEERLLESLELKLPRILKCGHFHLSSEEEADIAVDSDNDGQDSDADDLDICFDCGRRIRDGKFGGAGTGSKRWDIKLFAANGLMRAGAWSAAWREMERVDVEILPWVEEDMKRELELRKEEEERARLGAREDGVAGLDDERLREIYGGDAQAFVDGFADERHGSAETAAPTKKPERGSRDDVPLWDLFCNYIYHGAQDRRNIALFFLSMIVLVLSTGFLSSSPQHEVTQSRYHDSQGRDVAPDTASHFTSHYPSSSPTLSAPDTAASSLLSAKTLSFKPGQIAEPGQKQGPEQNQEEKSNRPSSWTEAAEEVVREMMED